MDDATHAMPQLKHMVSAYFHQDWDADGGEVHETVAAFLHEPREIVTSCADQIDELLEEDLAEGDLAAQLERWGCDYFAGDTDDHYRRWLTDVRRQIRAFLGATTPRP